MSNDPHRGPGFQIQNVWIYTAVHSDGEEGVIADRLPGPGGVYVLMPFVATDEQRRDQLRPLAIKVGRRERLEVKLIKLTGREVLETIYRPKGDT